MGWISVTFVHKFVNFAVDDQHERDNLLQTFGVDPTATTDPKIMITDTDFFGMVEHLADKTPAGRTLAIRVGASMSCDEYGAFGLAFKTAANLAGSYKRVERFGRVITSIANFRVVVGKDSIFFEVIPDIEVRPGLQMTNELALAAATALSREVSRDGFTPLALHLAHDDPGHTSYYHDHFQCPVHFQAGRNALEVSHQMVNSPNRLADEGISAFFDTHLDHAVADLPKDAGLPQRVQRQIARTLSEGVPKLSVIARHLGMSGRTLQRRLSHSEHTFQSLVESAQRELAGRLLRTTDHSIMEIAFLTGFTDQSTFARAFKRWHGHTPSDHREKAESFKSSDLDAD